VSGDPAVPERVDAGAGAASRPAPSGSAPWRSTVAQGRPVTPEPAVTGDRAAFLARLRSRLAGGVPANPVHPLPPPVDEVPRVVPRDLDRSDLPGTFERAAAAVAAVVHRAPDGGPPLEVLAEVVATHGVRRAVTSGEPEAVAAGEALATMGVEVARYDRHTGAVADLGVTGAVAAIAATGSVVVDAGVAGGRGASLLPPVHLCIVPVGRLVATPGDVLRSLAGTRPPSALTVVTGPSRTGDIEQLLTLGVHGPVAVHVVLAGA
jgi:L-lactate dehydrogenase complex protein LldG